MAKNKSRFSSALKNFFKNLVTKNVLLKVISLLFAMLLWGYVMMDQNPERIKQVDNVVVSFEGEGDLITRKFVVRGDRDEILSDVSARVSTELTKYADLDASDVTAMISLKNISKAGTYALQIVGTSTEGDVLSVNPNTVYVEIDNLVSRRIPITVTYDTDDLPENYWADTPVLSRSEIEIEGAAQDVAKVVRAQCRIDLTGQTESINESMEVELQDSNGDAVSSTLFLGQLPSVTVQMKIYPTVTVPIDLNSAILGRDSLPENYEIVTESIEPEMVTLAGNADLLEGITSVQTEQIDIAGRDTSLLTEVNILAPDGLQIIGEKTVAVYLNIREKRDTFVMFAVPIELDGLNRKLNATLSDLYVNVKLTGPISEIGKLERANIKLYLDLANMEAGVYKDVPIMIDVGSESLQKLLDIELSLESVTVTIE